MALNKFLRINKVEGAKSKTLNIDKELHFYLKRISSHYDISLSNLVNNILANWKETYDQEISEELIKKFKSK